MSRTCNPLRAFCFLLLLLISCGKKVEQKSILIVQQNDPSLESFFDSLDMDSAKYRPIIDSLFLFSTRDSNLSVFLDQCYWPYHVRKITIPPDTNTRKGFRTAEADKHAEWLFEKKTVNCGEFEKILLRLNDVKHLDSTSSMSLFLRIDPFGRPMTFVTLDQAGTLALTESYARDNMLAPARKKSKYLLDPKEISDLSDLLGKISKAPKENEKVGLDGTSILLQWCIGGKCFEVFRWCDPQELTDLWMFIENKLKEKIPRC